MKLSFTSMGRFLTAFVLVALVAGVAEAPGRDDAVRLRVAPTSVRAGGKVLVSANVSPTGSLCGGTIGHGSKRVKLRSKKARSHSVSWKAAIPVSAPVGKWTVRVACARAGSATATLVVAARVAPTVPGKIVVVKSGLSTRTSSGTTYASWGVVLQNVSPDEDARDVDVTIHYVDAAGASLRFTTEDYEAIPASATYYLGGEDTFQGNPPARIAVTSVQIGFNVKKALGRLAPVADIHESDDATSAHVLGNFENPYDRTLSSVAVVTTVCFDAAGNVIGGGQAFVNDAVAPGSRATFDVPVVSLHQSQIASAQVSVEPHFFN
jgi:hypothetical protein